MILIFVEHFLTKEGQAYFTSWIDEIQNVLKEFEGFYTIKKLEDLENEQRSLLLLKFESLELLRQWSKSEAHDQMIKKLQKFRIKKQQSQILREL